MRNPPDANVLIVPGLRDHVPQHWQTLLAAELPRCVSMAPLHEDRLSRAAQVAALDAALAGIDGPVILVAHSGGVITVAHWAAQHRRPVHGALLVVPPDFERELPAGYPRRDTLAAAGWLPVPRTRLPFPTLVAVSDDDPLGDKARVLALAADWGSDTVELGAVGHLNPAAGYGPWPQAAALIDRLR